MFSSGRRLIKLLVMLQDREHNFCLSVFWNYWWPGIFIVYPFFGRIWCAICPFMIYGEVVQRWRVATGGKLMKWPKEQSKQGQSKCWEEAEVVGDTVVPLRCLCGILRCGVFGNFPMACHGL
jgi:polyferredoxin